MLQNNITSDISNTKKSFDNTLLIVDGSAFLYRAFLNPNLKKMATKDGMPTNVIYGVLKMLKKLYKDFSAEFVAIVFDAKGKNFRHEIFPEYKNNRKPMEESMIIQIQPVIDILTAEGYTIISKEGVEADDVIATLTNMAKQQNINVIIATLDKDLTQLVETPNDENLPTIKWLNTTTNTLFNEEDVKEKYGVYPKNINDWLILVGDNIDNIPGVAKCGEKTATKWINEYGSLENLIVNADKIKGVVGENLRKAIPNFAMTKQLVSLKNDVKDLPKIDDLKLKKIDVEKLKLLYRKYELRQFLRELENGEITTKNANFQNSNNENAAENNVLKNHKIVEVNAKNLNEFADILYKQTDSVCFDFNAKINNNNIFDTQIISANFLVNKTIYLINFDGILNDIFNNFQQQFFNLLKSWFEDNNYKKIGFNTKNILHFLQNKNITLNGVIDDVLLENSLLNAGKFNNFTNKSSLEKIYSQYFYDFDEQNISLYSTFFINELHNYFAEQFQQNENQKIFNLYKNLELPLINILFKMERLGILVDANILYQQSQNLAKEIAIFEQQIYTLSGEEFNIASPKQLSKILFEKLQLPHAKNKFSTDEETLSKLAETYPIAKIILDYRTAQKLKNTYTDKLPKTILKNTGRIHTTFNQTNVVTGRLSSENPNLQNIPIRNKDGKLIRKAFIAAKNYAILCADYSQIELRIMAHLSGDDGLISAFQNHQDVHKSTASEIFKIPADLISDEQRRIAKSINFGLIYGMSEFGLSKQLKISRTDAKNYIERYFQHYPKVLEYMEQTRQNASKIGFVETIFGRRLYLPDLQAKNIALQKSAQRAAINAPMQGSAADLIKMAMLNLSRKIAEQGLQNYIKLLLQIHDELIFEVRQEVAEVMQNLVIREMCEVAKLKVPLEVSANIAENWADAH